MGKVGWSITQNTFKYFWSLFLLEEETSGKKKTTSKSTGKIKRYTSQANTRAIKFDLMDSQHQPPSANEETDTEAKTETLKSNAETNVTQISISQNPTPEKSEANSTQTKGALFDIPPDSEDL